MDSKGRVRALWCKYDIPGSDDKGETIAVQYSAVGVEAVCDTLEALRSGRPPPKTLGVGLRSVTLSMAATHMGLPAAAAAQLRHSHPGRAQVRGGGGVEEAAAVIVCCYCVSHETDVARPSHLLKINQSIKNKYIFWC